MRIVNAARGELIDDEALLAALESGRVAGAGLDVHTQEPPKDWRLAKHPKVVALPHLGASTKEAQERVGTDIAQQVRDFLKGGVIQQAVNFYSLAGDLYDKVRPAMDLAERLGLFLAQACRGSLERIELGVYGDLREIDLKPILSAAVTGVLRPAPGRGRDARQRARDRQGPRDRDPRVDLLRVRQLREPRRAAAQDERGRPLAGGHASSEAPTCAWSTWTASRSTPIPQGNVLMIRNDDTPGIVGRVGSVLGGQGVNIARMGLGRKPGSGRAIMLIEVDSEVPAAALAELGRLPGIREARFLKLG